MSASVAGVKGWRLVSAMSAPKSAAACWSMASCKRGAEATQADERTDADGDRRSKKQQFAAVAAAVAPGHFAEPDHHGTS